MKKFVEERPTTIPTNTSVFSLNLEASEVLELFQWTKNNVNRHRPLSNDEIKDEIADVLFLGYCNHLL